MTLDAGTIIYKAFVPTLKMALCIAAGVVAAKTGAMPQAATRGISQLTMNVGLPSLIFASMVSAFTPESVSAFGPLVMVAVLYQGLGLFLAWVVREVVAVPRDFRWGILVMGVISNWGNLPTAVVQTLAAQAPFHPETDVDLGVAYIAIFILVMNTTFFALGVHKICAWDFMEQHMSDPVPFRQRWRGRLRRIRAVAGWRGRSKDVDGDCPTATATVAEDKSARGSMAIDLESGGNRRDSNTTNRQASATLADKNTTTTTQHPLSLYTAKPPTPRQIRLPPLRTLPGTLATLLANIPPPTYAVALGLLFSLVQPLKALMVHTPGQHMPDAPDGLPPLHFVLDTAAYLGAITVPLALILLGASFARLKVPQRWGDLPVAAIVSMTVVKMVIVPVFSVFLILALQRRTALFPPDQKVRTFVAILLSGTPAAANQLVMTQIHNPDGTAHTLASFLLLQYALMFILSTALAAIALYIVQ